MDNEVKTEWTAATVTSNIREIFDPDTRIEQNFKTNAFLGTWYQTYRTKNTAFENGDNNVAEYSLRRDGLVRVLNSQTSGETGEVDDGSNLEEALGFARFLDPERTD